MYRCQLCAGELTVFLDLGRQPLSDRFIAPGDPEFTFDMRVGTCTACTMVQLTEDPGCDRMFHHDYPYRSAQSVAMREHFERTAHRLASRYLNNPGASVVEIGCNDGTTLQAFDALGIKHLGVEPGGRVAKEAAARGLRVLPEFFDEAVGARIRAAEGPADLIFGANTISHIADLPSVLRGVDRLLASDGVFIFEDPYLLDVVERTSFDQIIDEHFYLFSACSVSEIARRHGFELIDLERLPVHGGQIRCTLARAGTRDRAASVGATITEEQARGLATPATLTAFAHRVARTRDDLVALLTRLRDEGKHVVGYGATAKSATLTNYCGIGPDLLSRIHDSTPTKHGLLAPGSHIPVRPAEEFTSPYPDYALLLAWNHAEEIMQKERAFHDAGGRWILHVPEVHLV
ncbi:methyltransferase domain-containing protein [Saccharopolyspora sp. CA-218241]|uniref:methyltransferase domain-containing protein n=1 Tax=Saccharopolyspora sp. CA-218241 TaxID=3240027 RepID=UPI003D964249